MNLNPNDYDSNLFENHWNFALLNFNTCECEPKYIRTILKLSVTQFEYPIELEKNVLKKNN